ncbi:MAG TPA: DUF1841 family protein [Burkholderiales bacterium]|nr:DUF1841 family protein [Burkholderiales bacterium]
MFNPSRDQVRQFFFDTWKKYRSGAPLEGLESVAIEVLLAHSEYHHVLDDPGRFLDRDYTPDQGEANPFLHMSMHVAIEEQLAIDQPPGIKAEFERLLKKKGDRHDVMHALLDCLGEVIWQAQRNRTAPDGDKYLECLRRY